MTHRQAAFAAQTETMIKNLEKRGMEGYFFEDSASCTAAILSSIPEGSTISWGQGMRPDGQNPAGKL